MPDLVKSISDLPVAEINVGSRLRPISEPEVAALVELISEFGQTTPILVRRKKGAYYLVDGLHRLEATRRAGLATIPVRVYEMTDEDASLLEASQNLVGGMCPLDDAVFLAAWKRAHLKKHPETAQGVAGALSRHNLQVNSSSFAEIVALKRSVTVRQVQKIIAAGEKLDVRDIQQLRAAPKPVSLNDLQVIAKIGGTVERYDVVAALAGGTAKSAAEARRAWAMARDGREPAPKDPVEDGFKALSTLWSRAPMAARRRFVEDHAAALRALLPDEGAA